jgi:hypothetical protein
MLVLPVLSIGVFADVPYDNMMALYNMESELKNSISGGTGTLWNGASFVNDSERGGVLYLNNDGIVSPGEGAGYAAEGQWAELSAPYIPDSDAMTISIWFKATELRTWARAIDLGDAKAQVALAAGDTATVGPDRFINISPTNGENTIGTFNVNDSTAGVANNRDRVFADVIGENAWVHAVYVISKDGTPNVLYINGKAFESTHGGNADAPEAAEFSPKDVLAAPSGLRNVFLGRSAYENNGDQIFNGYIDDVTIFNVALTADQVAELNKADLKNGNPAAAVEEVVVADDSAAAAAPADAPAVATTAPTTRPAAPQTADALSIAIIMAIVSGAGLVIKKRK